jgi:hypothetical protein
MSECLDDPRSRHLLEMTTRLAEFHAEALDLADAEAFADEAVDIHIAHGHLSSSRARLQPDVSTTSAATSVSAWPEAAPSAWK